MCTIALATRYLPGVPVAVGANREERYDRPALEPDYLEHDPLVYGPMDVSAGGTWIALNENGLLVAITNRESGPDGIRSRGWLVRDLVRLGDVDAAINETRSQVEMRTYSGFNLVVADRHAAAVMTWDGTFGVRSLQPGIHVIVNEGMNDEVGKSATVRSRLQAAELQTGDDWEHRCRRVLRDHGLGVCRHGRVGGTRSSSIICVSEMGAVRWLYADGSPCEWPYRPRLNGPVIGAST